VDEGSLVGEPRGRAGGTVCIDHYGGRGLPNAEGWVAH